MKIVPLSTTRYQKVTVRAYGNFIGILKRCVIKGTCITSPKKACKATFNRGIDIITVALNQTWSYINNFDICTSARSCHWSASFPKSTHIPPTST